MISSLPSFYLARACTDLRFAGETPSPYTVRLACEPIVRAVVAAKADVTVEGSKGSITYQLAGKKRVDVTILTLPEDRGAVPQQEWSGWCAVAIEDQSVVCSHCSRPKSDAS